MLLPIQEETWRDSARCGCRTPPRPGPHLPEVRLSRCGSLTLAVPGFHKESGRGTSAQAHAVQPGTWDASSICTLLQHPCPGGPGGGGIGAGDMVTTSQVRKEIGFEASFSCLSTESQNFQEWPRNGDRWTAKRHEGFIEKLPPASFCGVLCTWVCAST